MYALAREKSKVLLGSRVLQHVRLTAPHATMYCETPQPAQPNASPPGTYAAAVRRIVIPPDPMTIDGTGAMPAPSELVLPPFRPIPAPRKSLARSNAHVAAEPIESAAPRSVPARRPRTARLRAPGQMRRGRRPRTRNPRGDAFNLGALAQAASTLRPSHQSLAETLLSIVTALQPLLALAPLLQGLVSPTHASS